jgi:hypothetical protein
MRPHLSISQPHFSQVPPPQSFCLNVFGWRTCGIGELQAGQFTDSRLIPQPFFVTVPNATNRMPTKRSAIVTTNTTFITWSGMSTSIRISSNTPTTMLSRIAFAYFMPSRFNYAPSHQALRTTLVGNRRLRSLRGFERNRDIMPTDLKRLVSHHGISWDLDCFLCAVVRARCCRCRVPGSRRTLAGPKRRPSEPIRNSMANYRSSGCGGGVGQAVFSSGRSLSEIGIFQQQ